MTPPSPRQSHDNNSAFQLHQATERYLATVLLVFTGTKPPLHDIEDLSQIVGDAIERASATVDDATIDVGGMLYSPRGTPWKK